MSLGPWIVGLGRKKVHGVGKKPECKRVHVVSLLVASVTFLVPLDKLQAVELRLI